MFVSFPNIILWWRLLYNITLVIIAITVYIGYLLYYVRLKKAHKRQQEFSHILIDLQEQERKRIAAELHDSIGQDILLIKNYALIGLQSRKNQSKMIKQLDIISTSASNTIQNLRKIAQNLRPILLDHLGLTEAIKHLFETISTVASIHATISLDKIDNLLDKESEINLFRIIQESLNNIIKHSQATEAELRIIKETKKIHIIINDNGRGMNKSSSGNITDSGLGLVVMTERIKMLGGTWQLDSTSGNGTTIIIDIPW
jgi:signal transduction histidine kinase